MKKYMCDSEEVRPGDFYPAEAYGHSKTNTLVDIVKVNGKWYALDDWNGECYGQCWQCQGQDSSYPAHENEPNHVFYPVYEVLGEDEFLEAGFVID